MNGPLAPWLTGAALLVLAAIGVVIRHKFEERESAPPPARPDQPPAGPESDRPRS